MCRLLEEMMKEAYKEGYEEEGKRIVLRMLEAGKYTLEEIIEISGLPLDEVKTLQAGQEI